MESVFKLLIVAVCVNLTLSNKNTYKAAIVDLGDKVVDHTKYTQFVNEAANSDVDILLVPSPQIDSYISLSDNYDDITRSLSKAAQHGGVYVVAHLFEKARCQNKNELIRSNLVFDRKGSIVSVSRKPVNHVANCSTSSDLVSFTTDFGVTFGLLMEEDLVLENPRHLKKLTNFVVAGRWKADVPFLSANQFSWSWAHITNANLVMSTGIYSGRAGLKGTGTTGRLVVAELYKETSAVTTTIVHPTKLQSFVGEDLNQYIIKPLDLKASAQGYKETVCHKKFCCEFYVKTGSVGSNPTEDSYGLAAFDGVRHFGRGFNIATQSCAVFACAGLYKRSCAVGSENNSTNTHFEKISITGNFTKKNSVQYPIVLSTLPSNFKFDSTPVPKYQKVTVELIDNQNLLNFGIFGRDFAKDFQVKYVSETADMGGLTMDVYDYFFNEDMQEFFDYLWIRIRILLFVVSIYVLEMM